MSQYKAISKWQAKNGKTLGYRLLRHDNVIIDMLTVDIKKYLEANGVNAITNLTLTSDGRLIYSNTKKHTIYNKNNPGKLLASRIRKAMLLGLPGYTNSGVLYYYGKDKKIHCVALSAAYARIKPDVYLRETIENLEPCDEIIKILPGTQIIDPWSFAYLNYVKNVQLPKGLVEIGEAAFLGCRLLDSIRIPLSVEKIGSRAFQACRHISRINININIVEDSICNDNINLVDINITNKVEWIRGKAFYRCGRLYRVHIPDSVIGIGTEAFANCSSLRYINIPESVKHIANDAFSGCKELSAESRRAIRDAGYTGEF